MSDAQNKTFMHRFRPWLPEVECRRWINPDGSKGGIVAVSARIAAGITIKASVEVMDRASIGGGASIGDGAFIGGGASIGDGASIEKDDWLFVAGPQGSRNAWATAVHSAEHGLRWWIGCQHGITTERLRERIADDHADNPEHRDDYLHLIEMVERHPGLARHKAAIAAAKGGDA